MQGDLDRGFLQMASASQMYPLAILQYFPSLISNPEATLATMARKHMSAATRELLGFSLPAGVPRPVPYQPSIHVPDPISPIQTPLEGSDEAGSDFETPEATPGAVRYFPPSFALLLFVLLCACMFFLCMHKKKPCMKQKNIQIHLLQIDLLHVACAPVPCSMMHVHLLHKSVLVPRPH
jgi:hypothetical protein